MITSLIIQTVYFKSKKSNMCIVYGVCKNSVPVLFDFDLKKNIFNL